MKKIICLAVLACLSMGVSAQDIKFLNNSICSPEDIPMHYEMNEYMQGSGHNFYLSYPVEAHIGSFSDDDYAYGSDDNPMVIVKETLADGTVEKKYYKEVTSDIYQGYDYGDMFISEGLWPEYSSEEDPLIGPELEYGEQAFQCILNKENYFQEKY